MNEFYFQLIHNEGAVFEVVWIDDSFRPDGTDIAAVGMTGVQRLIYADTLQRYPAERERNDQDFQLGKDTIALLSNLDKLYGLCIECGVNFTCANFEWAEENIISRVPDEMALLLDVENIFVGPLYRDHRHDYGVNFVKRKGLQLGQKNWKFLTRRREQVEGKFGKYANTDDQIFTDFTTPEAIKQWIESLNVSFHPEPIIRHAIEMYSSPWREGWDDDFHWSHDILNAGTELNAVTKKYREVMCKWLNVGEEYLNSEPTKCLFMWSRSSENAYDYPPWNFKDFKTNNHFSSRRISKNVLSKALKALDIRLELKETGVSQRDWFLPISPALPFLTSLRAFQCKVNEKSDPPLEELSLTRVETGDHDTFLLQVTFAKKRSDKETRPLGLQEHCRFDCQPNTAADAMCEMTGVCGAFHDLVHCRTGNVRLNSFKNVSDRSDLEKVFVNGTPFPVVGVVFGRYCATLIWKGQPED